MGQGLLYLRLPGARLAIAEKYSDSSPSVQVTGYFAWLDLIVIAAVSIGAIVYSLMHN